MKHFLTVDKAERPCVCPMDAPGRAPSMGLPAPSVPPPYAILAGCRHEWELKSLEGVDRRPQGCCCVETWGPGTKVAVPR